MKGCSMTRAHQVCRERKDSQFLDPVPQSRPWHIAFIRNPDVLIGYTKVGIISVNDTEGYNIDQGFFSSRISSGGH